MVTVDRHGSDVQESGSPRSPCVSQGCSPQRWCVWLRGRGSRRRPSSGRTIGPGDAHSPPEQNRTCKTTFASQTEKHQKNTIIRIIIMDMRGSNNIQKMHPGKFYEMLLYVASLHVNMSEYIHLEHKQWFPPQCQVITWQMH